MVRHIIKDELPGTAPGTVRFVWLCGVEQDNVALSNTGGMSSDSTVLCQDCEKARDAEPDAAD